MRTPKLLRCALLGLTLFPPARGQWQRVVLSGKGVFTDVPAPHPLRYFTSNPFLRDDGGDLCRLCTPEGKARSAREYAITTVTEPVGVLAGYQILDVFYYVRARKNPAEFASGKDVKWKFILVQVGPDRYREIFHLQAFYTTVAIAPSRVIQSGNERILSSVDKDGGNAGGCWEGYWWFDRSGPHSLDFSRVITAIKDRVPANTAVGISCSNLDLTSQQVQGWLQKSDARCKACDVVGHVTARFRVDGPILEAIAVEFNPGDPAEGIRR